MFSRKTIKTLVTCKFLCDSRKSNRRKLFKEALLQAKAGKVLYILQEELNELPQLSQDINIVNRHYLKMISFLYVATLEALLESISTLPDWQNVPHAIILDDLGEYCDKNNKHHACGVVAMLIDAAYSCSKHLKNNCNLYISMDKNIVGDDYCNLIQELYSVTLYE